MDERTLMELCETPDHHGSHRNLVPVLEDSAPGLIDAVIVPTVRHPLRLAAAKDLADVLGCTLVTLHSGKWTSANIAKSSRQDIKHIAIDIPDASSLRLIDFETSQLMTGVFARRRDTSTKRNLGLLLAHLAKWHRIIFLDDDISIPCVADFSRAAGLLGTYNAVGLSNGGFPDNSVVCHAYRLIGGKQESFIGGGALAVDTTLNRSFFPDVYNEDWFYLLDREKGLQPLAVTGSVSQQAYDPFREDRARLEEIGDVLAEGIFWLLDQGRMLDAANARHWQEFLVRRKRFIEYILSQADLADVDSLERARMVSALKASLGRLALMTPEWCERYVLAWTADSIRWDRHIQGMHSSPSIEDALRSLSRKGRRPLHYVVSDAVEMSMPRPVIRSGQRQFKADLVLT
jgi:hypothetical protein